MKTNLSSLRLVLSFSSILSLVFLFSTVHFVEAQPSPADTIRFLEQSTFGPTSELVGHVQQVGWEAFLNEQLAAPTANYPDLPFWPVV